ncbi:hypothetical protein LPB140_00195 [Sphingorhabdus lutea]|uniref:RHS repeat-associated core domain-containing protein n=1 Tax=Sphingorhabdus lutea TaxID=1913578 RepID=A0A1L3J8T7_9SPHN|nr:hypothetical protein LPB140_00195 [Sphingorhabdus lutea]
MNLYAYVGNDPVDSVDPSGKQSERAMDLKRGNCRGAEALRYRCIGNCAVAAKILADVAPTIADFIPVVGDGKGGVEFVKNPSVIGGLSVVSADGQRQVRMKFTEKGKNIRPHAHLEQRDARGSWRPVADDHIFFKED